MLFSPRAKLWLYFWSWTSFSRSGISIFSPAWAKAAKDFWNAFSTFPLGEASIPLNTTTRAAAMAIRAAPAPISRPRRFFGLPPGTGTSGPA